MSKSITFTVSGVPKPGGSKRGFIFKRKGTGKLGVSLVDASGQPGKDWRGDVKHEARDAARVYGWEVPHSDQPLMLTLTLWMPRPKSHYRKGGQLKPTAPEWHTGRPDATKLLRSIEDALTGILWNDDGQVVTQTVQKKYETIPGCEIGVHYLTITPILPEPA